MSVVAWDGKVLAADRQATHAELKLRTKKLWRLKCGVIVAFTGNEGGMREMAAWYESGADRSKYPARQSTPEWTRMVIVTHEGLAEYQSAPYPIPIRAPFFAFGTGRDYAMGALAMGASAREAVAIACRYSVYCGMGIDWLRQR